MTQKKPSSEQTTKRTRRKVVPPPPQTSPVCGVSIVCPEGPPDASRQVGENRILRYNATTVLLSDENPTVIAYTYESLHSALCAFGRLGDPEFIKLWRAKRVGELIRTGLL